MHFRKSEFFRNITSTKIEIYISLPAERRTLIETYDTRKQNYQHKKR